MNVYIINDNYLKFNLNKYNDDIYYINDFKIPDNNDRLDEDILKEYQIEKFNESLNSLDDYFWRYNQHNLKNNESYNE